MAQLMAIMGATLVSVTLAATSETPVAALFSGVISVGLLVAVGIILSKNA